MIEEWWIGEVNKFFASQPFKLRIDPAKSLRAVIGDLINQALDRQNKAGGTMILGSVMQHLVGAKLDLLLKPGVIQHFGSSVADAPTGRTGDFCIDDVIVHVTAGPSEALMNKCRDNINSNFKPIIVTISTKVGVAEGLADQTGIKDRVDVFELEQFMATNVYEFSLFSSKKRIVTIKDIVFAYNNIIDHCESDPGLRIDID